MNLRESDGVTEKDQFPTEVRANLDLCFRGETNGLARLSRQLVRLKGVGALHHGGELVLLRLHIIRIYRVEFINNEMDGVAYFLVEWFFLVFLHGHRVG